MKPEMKKLIIANLPYLLFVYLFGKLGQTYRLAAGADLSEKLLHLADGFSLAFESAAPSFHLFDLVVGVAGAVALRLMVYCKSKNAKKYRRGVEYGSARWGGPKDIAPYIDPVFDNNILLTQTERLTMNNRPKDPKTARNKNVLVIGGSGSGKTRFFVKPNLMQCVSKDYPTSFVITDPKGSLIGEVGQLLVRCGYRVKVLNTINFSKSMRYNPFRYIHSEKDILKLVNTLTPKPLAKIASGGELSRITLAIKNAMADKDAVPTVIYDEIDSGVSGKAAGRIGEVLRQSAQGHQILCITHTAQIAALADCHLLIQKNVANDRTYTEIHPLDEEGRVEALARLISGDHVTELSRANAREMLGLGAK